MAHDETRPDGRPIDFLITTGYGARTRQPFVNLTVGAFDFHVQMSPAEAVAVAQNLLGAAEAANADAFLIEWLRQDVGLTDAHIAGLLEEFRAYRQRAETDDA